jgi:hypothetical protein
MAGASLSLLQRAERDVGVAKILAAAAVSLTTMAGVTPAPAAPALQPVIGYGLDIGNFCFGDCEAFGLAQGERFAVPTLLKVRESALIANATFEPFGGGGGVIDLSADDPNLVDFTFEFGDIVFRKSDIVGNFNFAYDIMGSPGDDFFGFDDAFIDSLTARLSDGTTLDIDGSDAWVRRGEQAAGCEPSCPVFSDDRELLPISEPAPLSLMVFGLFGMLAIVAVSRGTAWKIG